MLTPLHLRVQVTIRQEGILQPSERVLVAVSGGQDSLCLLQILHDLAPRWQWQLYALHCDHRWLPSESETAQAVQQHLEHLGLPCAIATAATVTPDEAGARQWRYHMLRQWAEQWHCTAVVTGHTASDRAETILYNLIRGASSQGLSSLSWQRPLSPQADAPRLVRPLLAVQRHETAAFCRQQHLPVIPDPFNCDRRYARARLRLEVLPYLKEHFNPQLETALCRTATVLEAESDYLKQQCEQLWPDVYREAPPRLHQSLLQQQHLALQRRLLWHLLDSAKLANFERVEMLRMLVTANTGSRTASFPRGYWGEVHQGYVILRSRLDHESTTDTPTDEYDG